MEVERAGSAKSADAGFQSHWMEAAAVASSECADQATLPRTDADDFVSSLNSDMQALLVSAQRADAADAAEFGFDQEPE